MKTSRILVILGIAALVVITIFLWKGKRTTPPRITIPEQTSGITGCYVARTDKDVYTMNIEEKEGNAVEGSLSFKNFEKDSSSGTLKGIYTDGILLGDYAFRSEGMDSVMQVIFKKSGDDFIRGYGPVDEESGTRFTDIGKVTFEPSTLSVFKKEACSL